MTEFRKPNRKDLTSYVYPPSVGIGGKIIPVERTLHIGEKGVTEEDIKRLYGMDDQEVYNNIKNHCPPISEKEKAECAAWLEKYKSDFLKKFGYEPTKDVIELALSERYPKNWIKSLDQFESDDDGGDTSDHHTELVDPNAFVDPDDSLPSDVRRMREILSNCTDKQCDAYRLVCIEKYTEKEAAQIMGCTQQGVHKHLLLLTKKLKNFFEHGC